MSEMTGWKRAASNAPDVRARLVSLHDRLPFELREIIVLGMGGSALAAYVLKTFYAERLKERNVTVHVVDTTAPAYVAKTLDELVGAGTLIIVASKSGTTIEPRVLCDLFLERLERKLGSAAAAVQHVVALTDPGTELELLAREAAWLEVVSTPPEVGGRYSALTAFGLAPLVLAGVDVSELIERAQVAETQALASEAQALANSGKGGKLTDFLVDAEQAGRDVLLLVVSERCIRVGRWLEQLIAESLGKEGRGLIPIVTSAQRAEELLLFSPRARAVVSVVAIEDEPEHTARLQDTARQLQVPFFAYPLDGASGLGTLFVDWEFAVAACGERLGINPFDQPDVAASKEATTALLAVGASASAGNPPVGERRVRPPDGNDFDLGVGCDDGNDFDLGVGCDAPGAPPSDMSTTAPSSLADLASAIADPAIHYLALLAYLPYSKGNDELLQQKAQELEREYGLPVAIEYGPRYLHSTGQGYKGGPPTGLFLFVDAGSAADGATADVQSDLSLPGKPYTLAQLFVAQRAGDLQALAAKSRPVFTL